MGISNIEKFYAQYVDSSPVQEESFLGHFDFLLWNDLKKDLSACQQLQRKPFYKIALVSGNATYQSKSTQISISGHSIVFSAPLARFAFKTDDPHFIGKYCVCSNTFLRDVNQFNLPILPIFKETDLYVKSLSKTQYEQLMILFDQINADYKSDYPYREQLIRNRVYDVIHYMQKLDERFYKTQTNENISLESRFFLLLENAFLNINTEKMLTSKSPSYYADLLNTTVDNLNNVIKKSTGKTTQSIIHERIIEEANVFLKHTDHSVKEIAWCLHFQETSHFQNFYKRLTGRTPIEYRKRQFIYN